MVKIPDPALIGARRAPRRLAVAAAGVALSVAIMLILSGMRAGFEQSVVALVENTPAHLWVSDPAVDTVSNVFSLIDEGAAAALRKHPDVEAVHSLYAVPVMADVEGRKRPLMLYGYDVAGGAGGPWRLAEGNRPAADDEIVVDVIFAEQYGLRIGGTLKLLGGEFRITGLSAGTSSFMNTSIFAARTEVARRIAAPGQTSFLLVGLRPGADGQKARDETAALVPGLKVRTRAEMAAATLDNIGGVMQGPFRLLIGIAFVVGLLTTALMLYITTLEKNGEYQVLRALGGTPALLSRLVLEEAALVGLAGAALGLAITVLAARGLAVSAPLYPVVLTPPVVVRTLLLVAVLAAGGALVPIRRVLRLDPSAALRG
ncbi:MAG: ABC transporter permease [Firmicutes bacterium]|nr:ABC transporter permease [Bacillota bacterium]